jgi:hypothetical protein
VPLALLARPTPSRRASPSPPRRCRVAAAPLVVVGVLALAASRGVTRPDGWPALADRLANGSAVTFGGLVMLGGLVRLRARLGRWPTGQGQGAAAGRLASSR